MSNDGQVVKYEMLPRDGDGLSQDQIDRFRRILGTPGLFERMVACMERLPALEACVTRVEGQTSTCIKRCDASDQLIQTVLCPGQMNFSQRTLDEYSDNAQVNLEKVEVGLGGDYVNAFPIPPGKQIRLTHLIRPGYTPTKVAIDLNIAGAGNNYLDFVLQFYLVPGGTASGQGLEIGSQMRGNQFLNKDGTQIHIPFPEYRAAPIDVGSLETLSLVIRNNGAANNLDSAFVTIYYDNKLFYQLCKKRCGC